MEQNDTIVLFQEKQVRRLWHNEGYTFQNEGYFLIIL